MARKQRSRKHQPAKLADLELLSTQEVCKFLGIDRTTLYRHIREGKLKARRIGRSYKILKQNLVEYLSGD